MSAFTLDACCSALVERDVTTGCWLGEAEADGDADPEGDADADADADGEANADAEAFADGETRANADGVVLPFGAICALGDADSARADAISVGTLDFTTLSPLTTVKRSLAASYAIPVPLIGRSTSPEIFPSSAMYETRDFLSIWTRTRNPPLGSAVIARGEPGSCRVSGAAVPPNVTIDPVGVWPRTAIRSPSLPNAAAMPPGSVPMTL